jgi:spore coat polysaccharide biosynthesis protein SpsF (cytidylyltransferase family)
LRPKAFITVRTSSSRLPAKCLLKFGDNSNVLRFVTERARLGGFEPVICTSAHESDDSLESEAALLAVPIFRGSLENKLKRWSDCATWLDCEDFHVVDADDPFFNPEECLASLNRLRARGLSAVFTSTWSDMGAASVGLSMTSAFAREIAQRAESLGSGNFDVIPWGKLLLQGDLTDIMPNAYDLNNESMAFRLTLDYPEDYELLSKLSQQFGPESRRSDLDDFLADHSELRAINMNRTHDFLENKAKFLEENFREDRG